MQNTTNSKATEKKKTQESDIISLILEDHKPLKKLIKVMKDSNRSAEERIGAFKEFAPTLVAHAKPEEQTIYFFMKKVEDLREDGFEGDVEHIIADQLCEEIKRTTEEDLKLARIKVLAEFVEHHIEEEEEDMWPEVKKETSAEQRAQMGQQYLKFKLDYLAAGDENVIPDQKSAQFEKH